MAISQSIREQLDGLNEALAEAESFIKAFEELDRDGGASWVFAVSRQLCRISASSEKLECTLRQKAMPLLEDFDSVRAY